MSILNVSIEPYRALLGVDTAGLVFHKGRTSEKVSLQKATVVGNIVIAGRGDLSLYMHLVATLLAEARRWDVDALAGCLEASCDRALEQYEDMRATSSQGWERPELAKGLEIAAVGWSARLSMIVGLTVTLRDDCHFNVQRIESTCAGPGVWQPGAVPPMGTVDAMLTAMQAQILAFADMDAAAPIGGEAVFYEIDPSGIRQLSPIAL